MLLLRLKAAGVPAAAERLPQHGLQAVPGQPAAAGGGVRLREGAHPAAQRRVCLPKRSTNTSAQTKKTRLKN